MKSFRLWLLLLLAVLGGSDGFGMKKKTGWVAVAALMGLPPMAVAQADPANSGAPAPAVAYQSAFSDYKPWQDIRAGDFQFACLIPGHFEAGMVGKVVVK